MTLSERRHRLLRELACAQAHLLRLPRPGLVEVTPAGYLAGVVVGVVDGHPFVGRVVPLEAAR